MRSGFGSTRRLSRQRMRAKSHFRRARRRRSSCGDPLLPDRLILVRIGMTATFALWWGKKRCGRQSTPNIFAQEPLFSRSQPCLPTAPASGGIEDAPGLWPTLPPVAVYVISDLHLDDNDDARLFRDDRQGRALASLCEQIAHDGGELVLLGDIFDL